jgi:hypothetical protein
LLDRNIVSHFLTFMAENVISIAILQKFMRSKFFLIVNRQLHHCEIVKMRSVRLIIASYVAVHEDLMLSSHIRAEKG